MTNHDNDIQSSDIDDAIGHKKPAKMSNLLDQAADVARDAVRIGICTPWYLLSQFPTAFPARAIYGALCEAPPPAPLNPERPPFDGGQCTCREYVVTAPLYRDGSLDRTFTPTLPGPIGSVIQGRVTDDGARRETGFFYGSEACGGRRFFLMFSYGPEPDPTPDHRGSILSAVPADGGADDCGNPRPQPPIPPDFPPRPDGYPIIPFPPITRPVTDDDGGDGGDYIFKPTIGPIFIDAGGEINVPVRVDIDGPLFEFSPRVDVNVKLPGFEPTIVIGPGGEDPGPPDAPCCEPKPEEDDEPGDEDETEPELTRRIVGATVVCSLTGRTKATQIFSADGPTTWAPRLGVVNFEIELGDATFWSSDFDVKNLETYIPAPEDVNVTRAVFSPVPGVEGTIRTVSVRSRESI